jgi:hypothetical protein
LQCSRGKGGHVMQTWLMHPRELLLSLVGMHLAKPLLDLCHSCCFLLPLASVHLG